MVKALESPVMQVSATLDNPVSVEFPGPLVLLEGSGVTTPGSPQDLVDSIGPISGSWRLRRVEVVCRADTAFELLVDGAVVKKGYTSQAESTVSLTVEPWAKAAVGDGVKVTLKQTAGPVVDVTARVYYTEHTEA